jgi:tetratricopeptide (TPR) repeat protein
LRRAGLLGRDWGRESAPGDQQAAARELSIKLDGLPLALDQAGAFIEETPSSPIEYLQLYAEAGAELRRIGKPEHDSVHATFSLAFEKVGDDQGQYAKAEPLYQRALAIREKALGPEHPDVATSLENYAVLLRKMDRSHEATPLESRANAIRAKTKSA